jgi:hypothetical protein
MVILAMVRLLSDASYQKWNALFRRTSTPAAPQRAR